MRRNIQCKKKLSLFIIIILFLFPCNLQARRIKTFGEYIDFGILQQRICEKLNLSNYPEIGNDGIVEYQGRKYIFPTIFRGYRIYPDVQREGIFLVDCDGIIEFYVDLAGREEDSDVIDPYGEGRLRVLFRDEDPFKLFKKGELLEGLFLETHTQEEVKQTLLDISQNSPLLFESFEKLTSRDWNRLTLIANRYGLTRVCNYFRKLIAINDYVKYVSPENFPEEFKSDIFLTQAVEYLLYALPSPREALEMVEDIDLERDLPRSLGAASGPWMGRRQKINNVGYVIRYLQVLNMLAESLILAQYTEIAEPETQELIDAAVEDLENGLRSLSAILAKAYSNNRNEFYVNVLDEVITIMDKIKDYLQGNLFPIFRILGENKVISLTGNVTDTSGITFWEPSKKYGYNKKIFAVRKSDGSYSFIISEDGVSPKASLPRDWKEENWNVSFYLTSRNHDILGHMLVRSWIESLDNAGFRWVYQEDLSNNKTPKQFRIENQWNGFQLDLGGVYLSSFLNGEFENYVGQPQWSSHHYRMSKFITVLERLKIKKPEESVLRILRNYLYTLAPFPEGNFTISFLGGIKNIEMVAIFPFKFSLS